MKTFRLEVLGTPAAKGSMKSLPAHGNRFAYTVNASKKTAPWELTVKMMAKQSWHEPLWSCACDARLWFYFERPQSVNRIFHTVAPDIDKLARTILDALTGVVYTDDKLVVTLGIRKEYGPTSGVLIEVNPTEEK